MINFIKYIFQASCFRLLASFFFLLTSDFLLPTSSLAQPFTHPGMDQTAKDLAVMKSKVLQGEQPWKGAYDRLKTAVDTNFTPQPHTHVLRGPYGRPNIGGNELAQSANMAYNYALVWYITNDKQYAEKAMAILNAWSPVLWDFDYNDAKLLAAWTGHVLCNAAEILRYTNAGWKQKDIESFSNMLMTVYYPLMRYYYPTANGNWDGAIIHSIIAIAVFTDNRPIFNNAVDHFLHAPVNGSIFKYVYPDGQCQESMRDQGHVQLGLGEFAGAAQIAYTQGVDLFAVGNDRLAQGFEYTASFLLGETPHCYGAISQRAKVLRDDYEYIYRHYITKGVNLPWSKKAADSVRSKASRSVLTAVRAQVRSVTLRSKSAPVVNIAGATATGTSLMPINTIIVAPGESIQDALNIAAGKDLWIILKAGIHIFPATLKIPSRVTLCGEGLRTIIFLDSASTSRDAMVNATDDLHDVTIMDLVIECSNKTEVGTDPNSNRSFRGGYNRGGIIFRALHEGQMKNIRLTNLTVRNSTYNGVFISGADDPRIDHCDFSDNGGSVVPGPRLQHNLLLAHCKKITVTGSRLVTSPHGSGIAFDHCSDATVTDCEISRNAYYGILVSESKNIAVKNNLVEANDRSGVMIEFLRQGSDNISVSNNRIQYNNGYGVESYAAKNSKAANNTFAGNRNNVTQQKISVEKFINNVP